MVSVTMEDFWIKGVDEFANDTLGRADGLTIGINLFSILGKSSYEITKVELSNSIFHAIVLPNGNTNWDIIKSDTTLTPKQEEIDKEKRKKKEKDSDIHISLDNFIIKNMNLIYDNRDNDLLVNINNFNLLCSGNFSSDQTVIDLQGGASFVNLKSKGVPYLSNVTFSTEMSLDADFKTQKYILKENKICVNAITTSFDN